LTATNLKLTQPEKATCKNLDCDSSSLNNGSNQHSTSVQSPIDSELSPNYKSRIAVHSSDVEDSCSAVDGRNTYNDSESTTQYPLVVTADSHSGGIEPATGAVDADLTEDSGVHKVELNVTEVETDSGPTNLIMEQNTIESAYPGLDTSLLKS
jgi:hypothetical protein